MPIVNDAKTTRFSGAGGPAAAFEARIVATVGAGREVMLDAADNNVSPAKTWEARITQAV